MIKGRRYCSMNWLKKLFQNIPLAISAGAYLLLAVPATEMGLAIGGFLTIVCGVVGLFLPNMMHYLKENTKKGHWAVSIVICLLMGLRFDNVWKRSSQITAICARFNVDAVVILTILGCLLAVFAVYFMAVTFTFLVKWPAGLLKEDKQPRPEPTTRRGFCVAVVVVLILQLGVLGYWGTQKQSYHVDEVYTFELSNYPETIYGDSEGAYTTWKTGETFSDVLNPADGRLFDVSVPFWNGETDNHPSTYYILVHILSSVFMLFGGSVNKWVGLIPNFICCLITTYFLMRILQKLLKNTVVVAVCAAVWVLCIGTINMGIYLRMYAIVTMFAVIFCWLHLKFLSDYADGYALNKTLMILQLATIAGILSQYYFLFMAFFFCGFMCVYLFMKKDWKMLRAYMATEIFAVISAELLFPRMFVRLFFGDRGSEALGNMLNGEGYFGQLADVLSVINKELFGGYALPVIAIGGVLLAVSFLLQKKAAAQCGSGSDVFVLLLGLTGVFYILAVTKIAPYQADRYFMCIFPALIMCAVYPLGRCVLFVDKIAPKAKNVCVGAVGALLVICAVAQTVTGKVSYIYPEAELREQVLRQYNQTPVVVLNEDAYNDSVLQWAFEFQNYDNVFLCANNTVSDVAVAAKDGKLDNGFLLYVHMKQTDTMELFDQLAEYLPIKEYSEVANTQGCPVFYCIPDSPLD